VEPAPLGVKRARRSGKKAETKGLAPLATKAGRTAIGVGAEAKAIKEIDSEELGEEGAQAQMGANHAGKTAKKAEDQEAGIDAREGGGRKTTRATSVMMIAPQRQQWQWHQVNVRNEDSTRPASTPVRCW
jgi:hypothetical protein